VIADDQNDQGRLMARRRPKTPEQRRIAAAQAMIRRCHSDAVFRKRMIAIWRALMAQGCHPIQGSTSKKAAPKETLAKKKKTRAPKRSAKARS